VAATERPDAAREAPRIAPGGAREIGWANYAIARVLGEAAGGGAPPHIFTTLGRHRRLFRKWLRFAGALMPGGVLPRVDSELLILRVAHNTGCDYEWRHHERLGLAAGLSPEEIQRVREGANAGWSGRQSLLLRAADELHAARTITDSLWAELRPLLSDAELIELCMLVGHYEMLAMTLNSLAVEPDPLASGPPPRLARLGQRVLEGRNREAS
jgi:AhpD family alkylhydroperoxidase